MNRTILWHVAAAGAAIILGGCVAVEPPAAPDAAWPPPSNLSRTDPAWEAIRARTPGSGQPLALIDIADIALRNNSATAKAWHEARAAVEQVTYAEGYFIPSLTANAAVSRTKVDADPENFGQNTMTYGPGLQLNYLICNFGGGRRAAVEQALQTVYASNFAFNRALQDTLLTAEVAYYNLISAQAGVEAATTNSLEARAILAAATERRNAGLGVDVEVLQAQAGYDQSLYNLAEAEGQAKIAAAALAQAMGLAADTTVAIASPSTNMPPSLSRVDVRALTDEAIARRPDIAALRAALAAKEAAVQVARASRWPSLLLNGGVNRDYFDRYGPYNREAQDSDWNYTGSLVLRWNLFDGWQTRSSVRTAGALASAAQAQVRQAELAASAEIWSRYQLYETALKKQAFSLAALDSAAASRQAAMDSYTSGVRSLLDLLNAENQLAQARGQAVASRQAVFVALANLAHAVGLTEKGAIGQPERLSMPAGTNKE